MYPPPNSTRPRGLTCPYSHPVPAQGDHPKIGVVRAKKRPGGARIPTHPDEKPLKTKAQILAEDQVPLQVSGVTQRELQMRKVQLQRVGW